MSLQKGKTYGEEQSEFAWLVKFKPLATIGVAILLGRFNFELSGVCYVTPRIGIPIEYQVAAIDGSSIGMALLSGIEAVPATHREKVICT